MSLEKEKEKEKEKSSTLLEKVDRDRHSHEGSKKSKRNLNDLLVTLYSLIGNFINNNIKLLYYFFAFAGFSILFIFFGFLIVGFQNEKEKELFKQLSLELEEVKLLEDEEEKNNKLLLLEKKSAKSCFGSFKIQASKNLCLLGAIIGSEMKDSIKKINFLEEYIHYYKEEDIAFLASFFLAQEYENQQKLDDAMDIYKSLSDKVKTPLVNIFFSFQQARILYLQEKFLESYQLFINLRNQGENNPFFEQINSYLLLLSLGKALNPEKFSFESEGFISSNSSIDVQETFSSDSDVFPQ